MEPTAEQPLVSVIVPVYNAAKYLDEAIESILIQTYPNMEVIAVNDGSTDESLHVLEKYNSRITIIDSTNKGTPAARNQGIRVSTGSYLAFLDADDIWYPEKLSVQMDVFDKNPDVALTYCCFEEFQSPDLSEELRSKRIVKSGIISAALPGTSIIQREAFYKVGFFFEPRRTGEFMDWFARAKELGIKMVPTEDSLYRRRSHADNQSLMIQSLHKDYLEMVRETLRRRREPINKSE
jgi:glycosyltransferase involved in cell wall biosynthesis